MRKTNLIAFLAVCILAIAIIVSIPEASSVTFALGECDFVDQREETSMDLGVKVILKLEDNGYSFSYSDDLTAEENKSQSKEFVNAQKTRYAQSNAQFINNIGLSNYSKLVTDTVSPFVYIEYRKNADFEKDESRIMALRTNGHVEMLTINDLLPREIQSTSATSIIQTSQASIDSVDSSVTYSLSDALSDTACDTITDEEGITIGVIYDSYTDISSIETIIEEITPSTVIYRYLYNSGQTPYELMGTMASDGVDIIFFACNIQTSNSDAGTFTSDSYYVDYIIYNLGKIVVTMAGNSGNYVNSIAMAHNVISVGAVDVNKEVAEFSAYQTAITRAAFNTKPTLVAPGKYLTEINGESDTVLRSGTEYAAAFVAGAIAKYYRVNSQMMQNPEMVVAAFMNGATRLDSNLWHEKAGAGFLNLAVVAVGNTIKYGTFDFNGESVGEVVGESTFTLLKNRTCKVNFYIETYPSLASVFVPETCNFNSYKVQIYDNSNNLLCEQSSNGQNKIVFTFNSLSSYAQYYVKILVDTRIYSYAEEGAMYVYYN